MAVCCLVKVWNVFEILMWKCLGRFCGINLVPLKRFKSRKYPPRPLSKLPGLKVKKSVDHVVGVDIWCCGTKTHSTPLAFLKLYIF